MNTAGLPLPTRNPFATRYVRPGALRYRFADGQSLGDVLAELARCQYRAAIVGPHGAGKSTLLADLQQALADQGWQVIRFELHDGQRRLPAWPEASRTADQPTIVTVDGYEQLSRWQAWRLRRITTYRGWGLLVTSHHETPLPTLLHVAPSLLVTQALAVSLQADGENLLSATDVEKAFHRHAGNVRETFFALHSLYERRRRG
ncbi:MAG: hypothetical protein JSS27_16695 [Planctomycetes bacterium]|nr:hypothetical protein [Planctomycetota bacterium]